MARSRKPRRTLADQERWSQRVAKVSNALDLEAGVFTWDDPRAIAQSLKTSAEASQRKKSTPFRSAMSMLTFYINRAGSQLPSEQRSRLEAAKDELRALFGRPRHDAQHSARAAKSHALVGLAGVPLANMQVRNIGIIGYAVLFPIAAGLLASLFHRAR